MDSSDKIFGSFLLGAVGFGAWELYKSIKANQAAPATVIAAGSTQGADGTYVYASQVTAAGWQPETMATAQNLFGFITTNSNPCVAGPNTIPFGALTLAFQAAYSADPKIARDAGSPSLLGGTGRYNLATAQALALVLQLSTFPIPPCTLT